MGLVVPDVVRVTKLLVPSRTFEGSPVVAREPRVGDMGTVVHVLSEATYIVESVDPEGLTVWLADFAGDELALVEK